MQPITPANIVWREDQQPFSERFNDCYFSSENGLEETRHVFFQGNNLTERWQHLQDDVFCIGETGFGTGLNFIAAWKHWSEITAADKHLTFVSAEQHPLRKDDLIKAAALWSKSKQPELKPYYEQLIEQYPSLTPGFHTLHFDRVTLLLLLGDAQDMFEQLRETDHPDFQTIYNRKMDAWFLDGFAPAKNPDLWNSSLIAILAQLSKPGATAATFSAAGEVRRNLEAAGFLVQKQKGFAHKREMITAVFSPDAIQQPQISMLNKPAFISSPYQAPWYLKKKEGDKKQNIKQQKELVIIGAGIAGCTLAHALARKGYQVTVIDENPEAASGASGNRQAVLYSKFSADGDTFAQFNLTSYLHALRYYRQLLTHNPSLSIHLCGVLQLAWSDNEEQTQNTLLDFFSHYPDIAQPVTREHASELAGVPVETHGLFFPQAGWINPAGVCKYLLQHPNIHTVFNQRVTSLQHENNAWQLLCDTTAVARSQLVVIANGHQCQQFEQTQFLSLKFIRGQVSHAAPTTISKQLKTVVCGDGYIAPVHDSLQSFGASYTPTITHFNLTEQDHQSNLQRLEKSSQLLNQQWTTNMGIVGGRTHVRTATSDYFPLCGPLPDYNNFLSRYAPLRKNANANIPEAGSYLPNLYLFTGLGSRGMAYAPLCAEVLCQLITNSPLCLPRAVAQQLNPARFIIRDLIKNRL